LIDFVHVPDQCHVPAFRHCRLAKGFPLIKPLGTERSITGIVP
jgi:hypothetical protein